MTSLLRRQVQAVPQCTRRCMSQLASQNYASTSFAFDDALPKKSAYFVPRNTRGNLPVYTDVRNGGGRQLVLVRNVEGNVSELARDLAQSLFPADSLEASRFKIQISQSKHLVIAGGRWRDNVVEWLKEKGF